MNAPQSQRTGTFALRNQWDGEAASPRNLDPTANDADADGDGLPDDPHTIPHAAALMGGSPPQTDRSGIFVEDSIVPPVKLYRVNSPQPSSVYPISHGAVDDLMDTYWRSSRGHGKAELNMDLVVSGIDGWDEIATT